MSDLPDLSKLLIGSNEAAEGLIVPNDTFNALVDSHELQNVTLSFTIENPGPSLRKKSLFTQPYTLEFLERLKSNNVRTVDTSYCKYGDPYRKDTAFITNLKTLELESQCTGPFTCPMKRRNSVHECSVQDISNDCTKNSIPELLLHELLATFMIEQALLGCRKFHILDFFSGWESVRRACDSFRSSKAYAHVVEELSKYESASDMQVWLRVTRRPVTYCSFDAQTHSLGVETVYVKYGNSQRRVERQVRNHTDPKYVGDFLELDRMLQKVMVAETSFLRDVFNLQPDVKIAMLLHASPPCTTFSQAALQKHRPNDATPSELANRHDRLVTKLLHEIEEVTRGPL